MKRFYTPNSGPIYKEKRMKVFFCKIMLLIACVSAVPAVCAAADQDEATFRYQTVTSKDGLTYRVPEDMPIEKRGGIEAPIPFDEYMYGKFKQMDVRLQRMEAQLDKIQGLLEEGAEGKSKSGLLTSVS